MNRSMICYVIFSFCCAFLSVQVQASAYPALDAFVDQLNEVHANVHQIKYIKEIDLFFENEGKVVFVKDKGFFWMMNQTTFLATKDIYCRQNQQGLLKDLPYFSDIKNLTDDVFSGESKSLKEIFNVTGKNIGETNWELNLAPKQEELKEWIHFVSFAGNRQELKEIKIEYANGDYLLLQFKLSKERIPHRFDCQVSSEGTAR